MRIEKDNILVRDLEERDYLLMLKWLTDDRVLEFYMGRDVKYTLESLKEHYQKKPYQKLIIEYKNEPIGYGQLYQITGDLFKEYEYSDNGKIVYAMDQFIGEPKYWGNGIGTSYIILICEYLKNYKIADAVLLDPHINNQRAVKSYQKAGFEIVKILHSHELFEGKRQDCYLMEKLL